MTQRTFALAFVALFLLIVGVAPAFAAAPSTVTPMPTSTAHVIVVVASAVPSVVPSPTATALPTATPKPTGTQADGTFCIGAGFAQICPDLGAVINAILGALFGGITTTFSPAVGVTPPTTPAPTPVPHATPPPAPTSPSLLRGVLGVVVWNPDLTSSAYTPLATFTAAFRTLGWAIFALLFIIASASKVISTLIRNPLRGLLLVAGEALVCLLYIDGLQWGEHLWFTFVRDMAQWILDAGPGIPSMESTLSGLMSTNDPTTLGLAAFTFSTFFGAFIIFVSVVILALVALMRVGGLFALGAIYAIGPLCVALYVLPATRGVALWWLRSLINYSLWAVAYALTLEVVLILTFGFAHDTSGPFSNPLLRTLMGVAGIGTLLAVPKLVHALTGGLAPEGAGVLAAANRVRKLVPFL